MKAMLMAKIQRGVGEKRPYENTTEAVKNCQMNIEL